MSELEQKIAEALGAVKENDDWVAAAGRPEGPTLNMVVTKQVKRLVALFEELLSNDN